MLNKTWIIPVLLMLIPGAVTAQSDDYCARLIEERLLPIIDKGQQAISSLAETAKQYDQTFEEYRRAARASQCFAAGGFSEALEALSAIADTKQCNTLLNNFLVKHRQHTGVDQGQQPGKVSKDQIHDPLFTGSCRLSANKAVTRRHVPVGLCFESCTARMPSAITTTPTMS